MRAEEPANEMRGWIVRRKRHYGIVRCEPGWDWHPRPLPDYDLWHVVAGTGDIAINGEAYPVGPGDCFLLRPGDRIAASQHPDDRLTVIFVHFDLFPADDGDRSGGTSALAADPLAEHWPWRRYPVAEPYRLEAHLRELVELDHETAPDAEALFETMAKHVLLQIRRAVASGEGNAFDRRRKLAVRRAVEQIRAHLAAPPSHGELAEAAGLSTRYFAKVFRDETGMPLRTFIARARLERASQLLAETSMNVQQVADALGYGDIYTFSKQFKKAYGVPPSRMRHRG
jgi:AraC-like DNA-binding protein